MNGAPKQVENVASGSMTPFSVPATLAVYPDKKWNIASAAVRQRWAASLERVGGQHDEVFRMSCAAILESVLGMKMHRIGRARIFRL